MNFSEYKKKAFQEDPELLAAYKDLEPEYSIIMQIVKTRKEQNLTQKELAEKTGIPQSNISRFESGEYVPTFDFLKKIARGLGKDLHIELQ